jgi:glucose-6-phosphate isomerase
MDSATLWQRYQRHLCQVRALGLSRDVSCMRFEDGFLDRMAPAVQDAFTAMDALERGAIANPDENRMVDHLVANGRTRSDGNGSPGELTFCRTLTPQEVIA